MRNSMQNDEEQMRMLCLNAAGMSSGICLFTADSAEQQTHISQDVQGRLGEECYVIDMMLLEKEELPDSAERVRRLLKPGCRIVILCNLQLCGLAFGDASYAGRLNYIRDQLLEMQKVWILGMSPYFAVRMSQDARDLYSCIRGYYLFQSKSQPKALFWTNEADACGCSKRDRENFQKIFEKYPVQKQQMETGFALRLTQAWNRVYDCCTQEVFHKMEILFTWLQEEAECKEYTAADCISWQALVLGWYGLGCYGKALSLEKRITDQAERLMSGHSVELALLYSRLGKLYCLNQKTDDAEHYLGRSGEIYLENGMSRSVEYLVLSERAAWLEVCKGNAAGALDRFVKIENFVSGYFGKASVRHAVSESNVGSSCLEMGEYSKAFTWFMQAYTTAGGLRDGNDRLKLHILLQLGLVCGLLGDRNREQLCAREAQEIRSHLSMEKESERC